MKSAAAVTAIEKTTLRLDLTPHEVMDLWKMYLTTQDMMSTRDARKRRSTTLDAKLERLHKDVKKIIMPKDHVS